MSALSSAIIIATDDLEPEDVATLRKVITETLASFDTATPDPNAILGWTETSAATLVQRLQSGNRPVQAGTITAEAHNGGYCDRETVYSLGGYSEDRVLKGFTRPVSRIMADMQAEGLLPLTAVSPLEPVYDASNPSFQRAKGFRMPAELAPIFAAVTEAPAA